MFLQKFEDIGGRENMRRNMAERLQGLYTM